MVEIITSPDFDNDVKKLAKKYRSLPADLRRLEEQLAENPYLGTHVSDELYKVRIAIKSKGRGKSGGGRVYTAVAEEQVDGQESTLVVLLTIYDKSDKTSIKLTDVRLIYSKFKRSQEEE